MATKQRYSDFNETTSTYDYIRELLYNKYTRSPLDAYIKSSNIPTDPLIKYID